MLFLGYKSMMYIEDKMKIQSFFSHKEPKNGSSPHVLERQWKQLALNQHDSTKVSAK